MKILDRGYWVSKLFYYMSLWYGLIYTIRFQSFTFFSALNPSIRLGGLFDDRKSDVYKMIPSIYLPRTISFKKGKADLLEKIEKKNMSFPLIIKPDIGLKGIMVVKVENKEELINVIARADGRDLLVQEFLTHPREYSILYYRRPESGKYGVTSFVEKVLPNVVGDGKSSLRSLIQRNSPFLKKEYVLQKNIADLDKVIAKGERRIIDHVGNLARGSKFRSLDMHIDYMLIDTINQFFANLQGINFGRVDIKAESIDAVKAGNFKVLEINGAKAEPIHIYEPSMSFFRILKEIHIHWTTIRKIVEEQLSASYSLPSTKEGWEASRSLKKLVS